MFLIFLPTQRHLHPMDVENRPNGLTINIFRGRQVGTGVHKSESYYAFEQYFYYFCLNNILWVRRFRLPNKDIHCSLHLTSYI